MYFFANILSSSKWFRLKIDNDQSIKFSLAFFLGEDTSKKFKTVVDGLCPIINFSTESIIILLYIYILIECLPLTIQTTWTYFQKTFSNYPNRKSGIIAQEGFYYKEIQKRNLQYLHFKRIFFVCPYAFCSYLLSNYDCSFTCASFSRNQFFNH